MTEFKFKVGDSIVEVFTENETPLSDMPAFIDVSVDGELACRYEAMPTPIKDPQGEPCVVVQFMETSNNVGETEQ